MHSTEKLWLLLLLPLALGACGSDDAGGLLTQAPRCVGATDELNIEGTLDGASILDRRTSNINAGLVNLGEPRFDTPAVELAPVAAGQVELHLKWTRSLAFGESERMQRGFMTAPSTHPRAGESLCITAGEVGFVDGGEEDGVFKFRIDEVRQGADCNGAVLPVAVSGCFD